jgi:hypothetical protein
LTILNTSSPLRFSSFVWWSALSLKCLPFNFFLKNIPPRSWKQCVHALYPFFDYPARLLRAGQSLIITNNEAHRSKCSYLYSSHTRTTVVLHNYRSSLTNSLRYTSMSFLGCFGPWMSTSIIMNFRFMHSHRGML